MLENKNVLPDGLYFVFDRLYIGAAGVALFFILSGAVLMKNYCSAFDLRVFYKKRLIRILIPQIIAFYICVWLIFLSIGDVWLDSKLGFFISMIGLNYCNLPWEWIGINCPWIVGEWFTAVIIFVYVIFPLLRYLSIKSELITTVFIVTIFIVNQKYQIMNGGGGYFSYTNGLALFWFGMLYEKYKTTLLVPYITNASMLAMLVGSVFFSFYEGQWFYLNVVFFSIPLFIILSQIKYSNSFIKLVCYYNYELYLIHHRVMIVLVPVVINYTSSYMQNISIFLLMILVTFILSCFLKRVSNLIIGYAKQ